MPPRSAIRPGAGVDIVQKHHQRSGQLTRGVVAQLLTSSSAHPHGIKVRLTTGEVGRVQALATPAPSAPI
ncbi:YwbE family protein [Deinococcus frigens]|uniref:YwbE family protein n=1 Tax=Deinococcus frigens TaxID=249403 RepID=UPI0004969A70